MSGQEGDVGNSELDYYAILNLPRDASDEEVRKAYRNLAQVFHPDKHTDESLKAKAKEAFAKLQEAYEVLSDPSKRQVYDVYGHTGLSAGFEVGARLDKDELKRQWEEFQKKQDQERSEAQSSHRGLYICRLDATDWRAALAGARPLLRGVVVQNSLDVGAGEGGRDTAFVQGSAALRGNTGAGSLLFGYRRVLSPHDTLEASAMLGLRGVLTATTTRQVTPYTSASLTSSWTLGHGVGMQLATTRLLPYQMQATLAWVVGPAPVSGMRLSLSKRGAKYAAVGKLEVGMVTALSGRVSAVVSPELTLRAAGRVGTSGVDLELGAGTKWGSATSGYMGAVVGLQGVAVKLRLVRSGQTIEVPVMLSHSYSDAWALAAAYTLPPLTYLAMSRCVVRPLLRWQRRRREARVAAEHEAAVRAALGQAAMERALIEPVARRKARAEAAKRPTAGLVVLDAVYGRTEEYLAEGTGPHGQAAAMRAAVAAPAVAAASAAPGEAGVAGAGAEAEAEAGAVQGGGAEAGALAPPQALQPWLPVTAALQYLVTPDSRLVLHPGVAKTGLMGFADPTPGSETARRLYVAYAYGGQVYEASVEDGEGLALPGAGEAVAEAGRREALLRLGAAALGVAAEELLRPAGAAGSAS